MIERMKKIILLVAESDRDRILKKLRILGVLHVKHINNPEHHEIRFVGDRIAKLEKMMAILEQYSRKIDLAEANKKISEKEMLERFDLVEEAYNKKNELRLKVGEIKKDLLWYNEWGECCPEDIKELRKKGISLKLYRVKKEDLKKLKDETYFILSQKKGYVNLVTMAHMEEEKELFLEETRFPDIGPEQMKTTIKELLMQIEGIDKFFLEQAAYYKSIKTCEENLKNEYYFMNVKFGMQEEKEFSYIQGFCPDKKVEKIKKLSEKYKTGYLISEPEDSDEAPTLISNPAWIKIIDPVFQFMNTLPGYDEFDISPIFLVFFSVFFAMLVGDAGYGLIFLSLTYLLMKKFKKAPKQPFILLFVLSISTIIWGTITGTWFGAERISQMPILRSLVIPGIYSFSEASQNTVIYICFVIGAVHLTIAHLIKGIRYINSLFVASQLGWILIVWGMFFTAGTFVLGKPFPGAGKFLLIAGIMMVLFFSNCQKGIVKGALTTLVDLPLSVIGAFSDVVSYLRLFAVGYASVVVAQSFNGMALEGGINSILGGLAAACILFFGHLLNIILAFMAVIVHGVRLNMLEFSGHLGMQWSGKKYEPFCENGGK